MLVRKTVNPPYDYNHRKDFFMNWCGSTQGSPV